MSGKLSGQRHQGAGKLLLLEGMRNGIKRATAQNTGYFSFVFKPARQILFSFPASSKSCSKYPSRTDSTTVILWNKYESDYENVKHSIKCLYNYFAAVVPYLTLYYFLINFILLLSKLYTISIFIFPIKPGYSLHIN